MRSNMGGWSVKVKKKAKKNIKRLPTAARKTLKLLIREIEISGPVRGNWPNYGKLSQGCHHCHLRKGNPTYVAVWEEVDNKINLIEVIYAGTHEKAPY
jgi:mRNA-degrading endonuclease RelE of RelBE toxin-antitoxin system